MNVAFIPVRGGSKSIPLKNIKPINGKPLIYWTLKAACGCDYIDKVYVATDSTVIKETVEGFKKGSETDLFLKTIVIGRSAESATDTASTESAMLEFANNYTFNNIALVQATSPMLQSYDLNKGFEAFYEEGVDSVLSVVKQKRFIWGTDDSGYAQPTNYDVFHRPRRQDFDGYYVENGAFYIISRADLLACKNRLFGHIKAVEMHEDTFFEIDEPSDWMIIEGLMKKNKVTAIDDVPQIKMLLTDCDGCLTDGGMYYSEFGDELKKFNTRDGMGFRLLKEKGVVTGIITSEDVALNKRRVEKLKLDIYVAGCKDKAKAIKAICSEHNIDFANVCYIGDDINDLEVMRSVGYCCCPADAVTEIKQEARYITVAKGGYGVIREVADRIIHSRMNEQNN